MTRGSRTRNRRRSDLRQDGDGLLGAALHGVFDGTRDALESGVRRALRWTTARIVLGVLSAVVWSAALVLVLRAAVEALKELSVPGSLAHLSAGLLAAAVGGVFWFVAFRRRADFEE